MKKKPVSREEFDQYLIALTDLQLIQDLIQKHSTEPRKRGKYKGHSISDVRGWMKEFIDITVKKRADYGPTDGNLRAARRVGLALLTWYVRVHRAKAMDPRRPIAHRKAAYSQVLVTVGDIAKAVFNDCMDPLTFPEQEWESPWAPDARDGDFV